MTYYERIRVLREDHDMTQTEVANILNIGQRTYCDYERGVTRIPVERLITLARLYNVSMDFICGVSDFPGNFPQFGK